MTEDFLLQKCVNCQFKSYYIKRIKREKIV